MSLYENTINFLRERRNRILSGKLNCIPWGLPRFELNLPGAEQGTYYLLSANAKVGKTQITDHLFLYTPLFNLIVNKLNFKLKIFYFSLEMSAREKMLAAFSNYLFLTEGKVLPASELKSTKNPLSEETLKLIEKHSDYFKAMEKHVEIIDSIRNPTGIYKHVEDYALKNGKIFKKKVNIDGAEVEIESHYEPNDPEEFVFVIIDHISLITPEKRDGVVMNLRDSMGFLSSKYLMRLRDRFNYSPVVIQQQASAQESVENKKANKLKPSLDGLADNKDLQRDANVILGLFSPFRHEIKEYLGYDITKFKDSIRFLEIIGGRNGGAGQITPLYFNGAVNHFKELPKSSDKIAMEKVYKYLQI